MKKYDMENYGWVSANSPGSCDYIAPIILKLLRGIKVKRILDLGSGNGALCSMLNMAGYESVGVEYDEAGTAIARLSYPNISFYNFGVQDDPERLLAKEPLFDAVISTEVIEHLFSPNLLATYAARVLKDQGILIISTPYHGYLKNLALSLVNKWDDHHSPLWTGGHIKFWSRATLTELLTSNGFEVKEFYGVGRAPYLWKSMVLVARKI